MCLTIPAPIRCASRQTLGQVRTLRSVDRRALDSQRAIRRSPLVSPQFTVDIMAARHRSGRRDTRGVRIEGESGDDVGGVWAICTRDEAQRLLSTLVEYFEEDSPDPVRHVHLGGGDNELTIAIERNDAQWLLWSLVEYLEDDSPDPGWHHHVGFGDNLTISIELSE